ncbi:alpha-hydroxy acid oxidase [Tropicibacter naphthalenivorans]|uniref:L-lactate dehydrogenase [cytochrome] n=1 Tax=Tropicibacter naphthalenivorans TaxID=441103 RepID=A0A0N7M0P2_9RHOB|nr:alpha-hydroxy acid oxidase [Tropicibacter naphthalenivorans]CUH81017.1 L-lactate dehydrogenase [cytochrome] [Tropicibacter naphthalenivorans]SMC91997.1 4-hydroxymandelate oxidase [Tropicibacter naphthalenivorans]
MSLDTPERLPASLADYQALAQANLSPDVAAYFLRGAGAEQTLRANAEDLAALRPWPRACKDLRGGSTACAVLGLSLDAPLLVAPMAYLPLLDPAGEAGVAAAATAQGVGMVLSAQSAQPMDHVRAEGSNCGWMQLYWLGGRDATMQLAQRAARAGFSALVLTVDAPVHGIRDAELSAGFALPPGLRAVNLDGLAQPQFAPLTSGESLLFDRVAHVLPGWEDVAWLCRNAPLPVLLKGILHPDDARQAVQAGAAGVIVSNHGGRVLDGAPSSISALPAVVAAVGGAVPVLMDGGIRRGVDVFRALALGADAVLIGRPVCHGLAVAGALGASHVLRLLLDELEVTMALTGCRTLSDITRDCLGPSPF